LGRGNLRRKTVEENEDAIVSQAIVSPLDGKISWYRVAM